jgi:acetyl esterase/lipase
VDRQPRARLDLGSVRARFAVACTVILAIAAAAVMAHHASAGERGSNEGSAPGSDVEVEVEGGAGGPAEVVPVGGSELGESPETAELDVAAGSCGTVTYTPPTAGEAREGTLCVPLDTTATTVIVLVHGGAGTTGHRSDMAAWQAHYSAHGYVSLSIDYALLGEDTSATDDALYPLPEQNTKAAVQFVRLHEEQLETTRVVVQGHSAGARLGAVALTTADSDEFTGNELWPGVSDAIDGFVGFYGYYDGLQFDPVGYYGDGGVMPDAVDSIELAGAATGPVLLFHGESDVVIPSDYSAQLAGALRAAGQAVDLVLVDGANHGYDGYDQEALTAPGLDAAATITDWLAATS